MKELKMYIGLKEGYNNGKKINKNKLLKRVINLFDKYTHGHIKGFNVSFTTWTENKYKEESMILSTYYDSEDINLTVMLENILYHVKKEFKQESILYEISDVEAKFY